MKKLLYIAALFLLVSLPLMGHSQGVVSNTFRGALSNSTGNGGGTNSVLTPIPTNVLIEVLTQAAPSFGFRADDFISLYYTCYCITVEQIGPNTYLVVYGGLGIQIIIDGSRLGGGQGQLTGSRR